MAFIITCISTLVSWICQPVGDALQRTLQTAAEDFFGYAVRQTISRFISRRHAVEELPVSSTSIVGAEETLAAIRSHLRDESVGIIGIYGMAGIGKTTLLKKINNDFFQSGTEGMFDLVIWITVSKDINILNIQKGIGDRVDLSFSSSDSGGGSSSSSSAQIDEQAKLLFKELSKKRFLLILDDVWAKLDLLKIGIPLPRSRRNCKIAFSTRSLDVCSDMDADKSVKVELLDEALSWELFCTKVREERVSNPSVQPLAKLVVSKCGGLPLALITVGRAMANKTRPSEWKHAIKALDDSAEELRGMDVVLSALKFSYDNLEKDVMRSGLLYCAMYPEDHDISREEIVEYWIGEGLLDDGDDEYDDHVDDARNRGQVLISNLQAACLLEEGGDRYAEHHVKLHDSVRDMAIWLNSGGSEDLIHRFMVFVAEKLPRVNMVERWAPVGERLTHVTKIQRWEHVRRLWMRHLNLRLSPPYITNCPNSCTLLLNHTSLGPSVLQGFLDFMRALRVLDLSSAKVEEVPVEIGLLVELRYLNLSFTDIRSLPVELGNLIRLRQLMLQNTFDLRLIPRDSIVRLPRLQVLNMWFCRYDWDHSEGTAMQSRREREDHPQHSSSLDASAAAGGVGRQLELGDLDDLRRLEELWISISNSCALESLSSFDMPCRCTRGLSLDETWLGGDDGTLLRTSLRSVGDHLTQLDIRDDATHPWVGELRFYLDELPCLETLKLHAFHKEMKVVVVGSNPECSSSSTGGGNGMASCVAKLRELQVLISMGLKDLKLVGRFPCLQQIDISTCLGMEELVLGDEDGVRPREGGSLDSDYPMLKTLNLQNLPKLRNISHRRPLLLPSLETMAVSQCPQLRQLPLGRGSAPKLRHIFGTQEWWDALEWAGSDGSDIKAAFVPR